MRNADKEEKEKTGGEKQDECCSRELIEKEDRRQIVQCACFLLIQIRFHKDPHDCLITRRTQRGMRRRDEAEASRDTMKLINSCLPSPQLLSMFFQLILFLNGLNIISLTVICKGRKDNYDEGERSSCS